MPFKKWHLESHKKCVIFMRKIIMQIRLIAVASIGFFSSYAMEKDPQKFVCNDLHESLQSYFQYPWKATPPSPSFDLPKAKEQLSHLQNLRNIFHQCNDKELAPKSEHFVQNLETLIKLEEKTAQCNTYLGFIPRDKEKVRVCRNKAFGEYLKMREKLEKQ
jgi:hypothetical protein